MALSLSEGWKEANSKIDSLVTYKKVSQDSKQLTSNATNSNSPALNNIATQLNKIKEQQKRYQREVPTSMDQLLNLLGKIQGNGDSSINYLRKKVLEVMVKMEPKANEIVISETIKTLGCSQQQTYPGIQLPQINPIPYIQSLPVSQGIYVPVKSIDFMSNLKIPVDSLIGKYYYEKQDPSTDPNFKPYGGKINYPFNKMLNLRMNSGNISKNYSTEFGNFYNGRSSQNLLDIQYTTSNDLGVSGDFFRIFLLDRNTNQATANTMATSGNTIHQFLSDYFSTIKLVDPVNVTGTLLNYSSGFIDIKGGLAYDTITNASKAELLMERILGLCNDNRREIDVSGISKIAELDGVDETFFEFNEVDLRKINNKINNIQKGIVTFESCGNVELPVNTDTLLEDIINFRDSISGNTPEQTVTAIENLIDSFTDNPSWKPLLPTGVNGSLDVNKNIIKNLPKAIASGILTPKVLLPIFVLIQVIETSAKNKVNNLILTGNSIIQSANTSFQGFNATLQSGTTTGQEVDNVIDNSVDFFKKFKTFVINTIQRINAEFLKELYEILKKDILNLLNVVITDIQKSATLKRYTKILRLVQIGLIILQAISDYRKCKSLVDDILNLINLINSTFNNGNRLPAPLLFLTQSLPGFSPERALINGLKILQERGLPTGDLPDGSPNLMNQFMDSLIKGMVQEEAENGTIDATVLVPPLAGGLLTVFAKSR